MVLSLDKVIPSELSLLDDAVAEITAAIDGTAYREDTERIGLAVREALVNAAVHGNQCEPQKAVCVCAAVYENSQESRLIC
jgi:anti-sigma regulatory factor (Ser/Thr protein kinase)